MRGRDDVGQPRRPLQDDGREGTDRQIVITHDGHLVVAGEQHAVRVARRDLVAGVERGKGSARGPGRGRGRRIYPHGEDDQQGDDGEQDERGQACGRALVA